MSRKLFYLLFILISIFVLLIGCDQNPFFGMGEEVDTKPPTFKITSHINGDFVASNFTVEGTCSDNVGVTKIIAKLSGTNTSWNATIINKTSWKINITGLTEGEKTLDIYAYDAKNNSAYTKLYVIVDTGLPTVTVTEPELKSLSFFEPTLPDKNNFDNLKYFMNGTFKIKGYVDDKFIIKKTTLKLAKSTDLQTDVLTITIEKDKPLPPEAEENSFPTKWTFNIDSTKLTDKTAYMVKIETEDQAGNKNVTQSLGYIYVDQDMDKPNGKINSPSDITFPQSIASGTAWDDDGLSKIYWYVGKSSLGNPTDDILQWVDASTDDWASGVIDLSSAKPNITSWNFTTPKGTGEYKIYVCPVDINNKSLAGTPGSYFTNMLTKTYNQQTSDSPVITITGPDPANTYTKDVTIDVEANGGTSKNVTKISYKINNGTWVDKTDFTPNNNVTYSFGVDTLPYIPADGSVHDIKITVKCENQNSEVSLETYINLKVDNTKPTVNISSPDVNSGLNGITEILGSAEDDWSGVKSIYYGYFNAEPDMTNDFNTEAKLEAKADTNLSNIDKVTKNWHKVSFTQASWSYNFDTTKISNGSYKLYIAVVDKVGNVGWNFRQFNIDQELDKPNARILVPTSGSTVIPQSMASGDATDDDGLSRIHYRIRLTSLGVPSDPDPVTGWGTIDTTSDKAGTITISGSPKTYSWQVSTPNGDGEYTIYIRPVDINNVMKSTNVTLTYNQKASITPTVQITQPNNLSINYTGMVNVTIRAIGGSSDKVTQIVYRVRAVGGVDSGEITVNAPADFTSANIVDYPFSFNSATYTTSSIHDIIISAYCKNESNVTSSTTQINIKADNTSPTVSITSPNAGAGGLNGMWPILGTVSDDWSGVKTLYYGYFTTDPNMTDFDTEAELEAKADTNLSNIDKVNKNWHKITFSTPSWSYNFDTTKITSTTATYNLYVAAVDNVGKVGWTVRQFNIDQDADKPVASITAPHDGASTFPESIATGIAQDDDGLKYIYIFIGRSDMDWGNGVGNPPADYTTWPSYSQPDATGDRIDVSATNPKIYNWQLKTPSNTGPFRVWVKCVDMNTPSGTVGNTVYHSFSQTTSTTPIVSIISPDPAITQRGTMNLQVNAQISGYTITTIKYRINEGWPTDSGEITLTAPGDFTEASSVTKTIPINTTLYTDADNRDVKVKVWAIASNSAVSQAITYYYKADNASPDLAITSPSNSTPINGIQRFQGTVSDWSGIDALYFSYYLTTPNYTEKADLEANTAGTPTLNKFYKVTDPSNSWSYNYDTNILTSGQINNYQWTIYAVDKVGNVKKVVQSYNIDQDVDRPYTSITTPEYTGSTTPPYPVMTSVIKVGSKFLIMGTAGDDDGVAEVRATVQRMQYNGNDNNVLATIYNDVVCVGTLNWSLSVDLPESTTDQYYRVTTRVKDIYDRWENSAKSYFIVSNEMPQIEIVWPSTLDPEGDTRWNGSVNEIVNDSLGTIISNIKDDIYWDNITTNNHLYLDGEKKFFGWENSTANADTNNDGIPDTPAIVYSDFNMTTLGIFGGGAVDTTRANYFRLIFKAKDPNTGGDLRKVEISYDGGNSWTTIFNWNGTALVSTDPAKYSKTNKKPDGTNETPDSNGQIWTWFYVNYELPLNESNSRVVKIRMEDNNETPAPYIGITSIQITYDTQKPTGSITNWGTATTQAESLNATESLIRGNASDGVTGTGIRHVLMYIWDNEGTVTTPKFSGSEGSNDGTGDITLNVGAKTFKIMIPEDTTYINGGHTSFPDNDVYPDYVLKATMITPENWQIDNIYTDLFNKYGTYPIDGNKLIVIKVVDNAGNFQYAGKELNFSQYPPSFVTTNVSWTSKFGSVAGGPITITGETPVSKIYISGTVNLTGTVKDGVSGDPIPGIERVRVYIKNTAETTTYFTWGSDITSDTATQGRLTASTGSGSGNKNWNITTTKDISVIPGLSDGDYKLIFEVRDLTGVIKTLKQDIYVDNTEPSSSFIAPSADNQKVTGTFTISGNASDVGGYDTNSITIKILTDSSGSPGSETGTEWTITPSGGTFTQSWLTTSPLSQGDYGWIRVIFTDKAKNRRTIDRRIQIDPNPPAYTVFTVSDQDGAVTPLNYSAFTNLYPNISNANGVVYIVRGNTTFNTTIQDDENITDASVDIFGRTQGSSSDDIQKPLHQFDTPTGLTVSDSDSYNLSNQTDNGQYIYRSKIKQGPIDIDLDKYFIVDNQKPHIWLFDMQATDYVTSGSTKYGHIDVGLNSNGSITGYDDISGVIKIKFAVFDNYIIDRIQIRWTDNTQSTYRYNFGTLNNWHTIASFSNGTWTVNNSGTALGTLNYWKCTKITDQIIANRHYAEFEIEINTANMTNVVGLDNFITFRVFDKADNESYGTDANDVSTEVEVPTPIPDPTYNSPLAGYQKWARKPIDVVPYITSLERVLGADNTYRTKYGKYILREGENNLKIYGYNLAEVGTSWIRVYNSAGGANDDVGGANYIANATYTLLTITNVSAIQHSGLLRIAVNNIEAINNVNNNTLDTNKEDDGSGISSTLWNDDRYVQVWEYQGSFDASLNPVHPAMEANRSTWQLWASWSNYASCDTYLAALGPSDARTSIHSTYDPPDWTDIYVQTSNTQRVAYLQNYYNGVTTWGFLVTEESANGNNGNEAYIEHLGTDSADRPDYTDGDDEMMYQFQNPRIAYDSVNNRNYVSYYDAYALCLKYGVTQGTTRTLTAYNTHQTDGATVVDGIDDTTAPPTTSGDDVGLWSSIQIDAFGGADATTPIPVIMYYDSTNSTLKIARGNNNMPNGTGEWTKQEVFRVDDPYRDNCGYYVSMKLDGSGNVHAVAYRISTGDLIYLYAPNIDGIGTYTFNYSTLVDSNGAVGIWADIDLVGSTPYVSYLTSGGLSTFSGLKYAYYDIAKNDWEHGIVATNSIVKDGRTSIVVRTTSAGWVNSTKGKTAIAYVSGNYDLVILEDEE